MTTRVCLCILEDDPAQVLAIKQSIKIHAPCCSIRIEQDGRSFLENISNLPVPDLIILDINVPVISGFEVLRKIRERRDLDYLPVVMFSTDDSAKNRLQASSLGANGFELKPPLAKMGVVIRKIVETYKCKTEDKPDKISPFYTPSNPSLINEYTNLDDMLDDL